jgi:hypothetical protein
MFTLLEGAAQDRIIRPVVAVLGVLVVEALVVEALSVL